MNVLGVLLTPRVYGEHDPEDPFSWPFDAVVVFRHVIRQDWFYHDGIRAKVKKGMDPLAVLVDRCLEDTGVATVADQWVLTGVMGQVDERGRCDETLLFKRPARFQPGGLGGAFSKGRHLIRAQQEDMSQGYAFKRDAEVAFTLATRGFSGVVRLADDGYLEKRGLPEIPYGLAPVDGIPLP